MDEIITGKNEGLLEIASLEKEIEILNNQN
jgi:hypothetical protein